MATRLRRSEEEHRFNRAFGARMRDARKRCGKSQQDIADGLRIGIDQYKKHELGLTTFPPYLLVTLAGLLSKSLPWLITGRD